MTTLSLNVNTRSDSGKGSSRRLRRSSGLIPAVIYGGSEKPASITLEEREINKLLQNESAFSQVITLINNEKKEPVLIKALQRHPAKEFVLHVDFQRIVEDKKLTAHVPLHFINESNSVGVKSGGRISHIISEVEVYCLPKDLPAIIEVDLKTAKLGQIIHLSDLKLSNGVELVQLNNGNNLPVVNIYAARGAKEETKESTE